MSQHTVEDVALFFDFENISISLRKQDSRPNFKKIMRWVSQFGRVVLARAYADWNSHNVFLTPLQASGFDPVFVTTYFNHQNGSTMVKNAVDMQIAVEATAVSCTHSNIKTFGLLTGDKDYLPLVHHLRSLGKKVVVLAVQDSASVSLEQAVDIFCVYREMLAQVNGTPGAKTQPTDPIFNMLTQAIQALVAEGKIPLLERIKPKIKQKVPGFDEKLLKKPDGTHFMRFLDFVQEAEQQGIVTIVKKDNVIIVNLLKPDNPAGQRDVPAGPQMPSTGMPLN